MDVNITMRKNQYSHKMPYKFKLNYEIIRKLIGCV